MARHLAKYGKEALLPHLVNGCWRQPKISGRQAADLKKQFRKEGKEWPLPEEPKKDYKWGFGLKKKPKGHKHEREAAQRKKDIAAKMEAMPKMIAEYRESRKLKPVSIWDEQSMTRKQLRMRQYRTPTNK